MERLELLQEELRIRVKHLLDLKERAQEQDNRSFTEEEKTEYDRLNREIQEYKDLIDERKEHDARVAAIDAYETELLKPSATANRSRPMPSGVHTMGKKPGEYPSVIRRSRPLRAFSQDREGDCAAYRTGRWLAAAVLGHEPSLRWCDRNLDYEVRIMKESVVTGGGALVPTEAAQRIIDQRESYGVFRRWAYNEPMMGDTKTISRQTGGPTAYFVNEASSITASDAAYDVIELVAKKVAAMTRVSSELDEDSMADLGDRFVVDVGKAFGQKEDQCGWSGDGTSTYGGMVGIRTRLQDIDGAGTDSLGVVAAASGNNTFATIDAADLDNCMATLPQYAHEGDCAWYTSIAGLAACFHRLSINLGGAPKADFVNGMVASYAGYPIRISQSLPTTTSTQTTEIMLLFGDLSQSSTLGDRRGITIARDESRYFDTDEIALKGTERFQIVNHNLGDSATAGAVVGLQGTA